MSRESSARISRNRAILASSASRISGVPVLRSPIDGFRIIRIGGTIDFGRRADAIFTRFIRLTLCRAISTMEHIRRKVDAKIEIFAFIGLRP